MPDTSPHEIRSLIARIVYEHGFTAPRLFQPVEAESSLGLIVTADEEHCLIDLGTLEADLAVAVSGPVELLEAKSMNPEALARLDQRTEPL